MIVLAPNVYGEEKYVKSLLSLLDWAPGNGWLKADIWEDHLKGGQMVKGSMHLTEGQAVQLELHLHCHLLVIRQLEL